ncbi:MAG TPA: hypothetical protein VL049_12930 [Candidatus Dormibacteraeota bacterium]|nr:hypothetical protein [Candidatus Dormibacteraeota bacterium]
MTTSQTSQRAHDAHWGEQMEAVRAELAAADRKIRALARTQPLTIVMAALAAGFVLGRLIRR